MNMPTKYATGEYAQQVGNYLAFIPAPLPPTPSLVIDSETHTLLSKADRALGRLDGSINALPNADLFVMMYVRKEAVLSSQIEGTQASLADVLEAEAKVTASTQPNDVDEVINYVTAMNAGLKRLEDLPVSIRLIKEIHAILMSGVRGEYKQPGEVRTIQNWIGPEGALIDAATYVPPPPTQLGDALHALELFLNDLDTNLPPLIRFGLAHAQFETIHPFLDGNGRMGRLLVTFLLCRDKILSKPVLYMSHYLKRHRARYYDLLQATRIEGDWESWLKFFLTGVSEVANEAAKTANQIVELRENHRSQVVENHGRATSNSLRLLEELYRIPITTPKIVSQQLGISYAGANGLISRMEEGGLLTEITGQSRNRIYRYEPYMSLF